MLKKEEAIPWPGTLAIVHSYIAYKAGKELPVRALCHLPLFKKNKKSTGSKYLLCFKKEI